MCGGCRFSLKKHLEDRRPGDTIKRDRQTGYGFSEGGYFYDRRKCEQSMLYWISAWKYDDRKWKYQCLFMCTGGKLLHGSIYGNLCTGQRSGETDCFYRSVRSADRLCHERSRSHQRGAGEGTV